MSSVFHRWHHNDAKPTHANLSNLFVSSRVIARQRDAVLVSFYLFHFEVHSSLFVKSLILERIVVVNERTPSVPGFFQEYRTRWQERLTRAAAPQWTGQSLNWAGRGGNSTLALADLLAPAQTSPERSLATTCHLHLSMQFYFMTMSNRWP